MAELTPTERLQPSLLDRLTDDEPSHSQEARNRRVLSIQKLRESVLRDVDPKKTEKGLKDLLKRFGR